MEIVFADKSTKYCESIVFPSKDKAVLMFGRNRQVMTVNPSEIIRINQYTSTDSYHLDIPDELK